jgi:hypothetical protein
VFPAAISTVPAAGEYTNVPGIFDVAFSCVELKAVPHAMFAGGAQVMVAGPVCTVIGPLALADVKFASPL